ncbi:MULTISPECIES: SDR family NAD(P)-dependent oxidoreductase [Saccharothrix]|uniref:SDR family NAD(P)-dependent oxidoreductase n=1 Tax=Saccharothrix TaxID=2071 RepID=UPI00093E8D36|nr:SDR family NAD(P)-dependent oxidoreductase [Saccharothrix sp. CB00851]OKI24972.1 hypothetical protein A6A25_33830 [Saccharothrix sp. CB00851]
MSNIVISGGTDGIGRALALHRLRAGDRVVVIGRSAQKGAELAREADAGDRFHFIAADLALVAENQRVVAEVTERLGHVDALVLCAAYLRMDRVVTAEGFEHSFALAYLSRFVLSTGLAPLMRDSAAPVIVNLAVIGAGAKAMNWDDMQFTAKHRGGEVWAQTRRANELLGVGFAAQHGLGKIKYVLFNPVYVRTSFAGEFPAPVRFFITLFGKLFAKPVEKGVLPIVDIIERPPAEEFSVYKAAKKLDHAPTDGDREDAERLFRETK